MARPRSFDTTAALDAAIKEFRINGFEETSTDQLCEAAGVRRSSLYNAFVSKDELFIQALERYTEVMAEAHATVLTDVNLDGGTRLRRVVEMAVDEERAAFSGGRAAGCMIVQSYMSPTLRARDGRIQDILDRDLERRLEHMVHAATIGQSDGSVTPGMSPEDVAMLVITAISGMRVTAGAGAEPDLIERVAKASLDSVLIH
ncbi:AcrR family transcriptional regulator [Arthrobacter sp. JUb119]|uniref:TetR/AcrR family transcriptional regulator n=1 Tax=Arthrobacter sp. JUb115 TaxID=2485108 RepID=UPI00105D4B65|nr:TetR/AcrR family transcriptional regulator [Arthrobacter sp. JUb115]MCS3494491.1 AcrR family transcriptional regulator [Arthrobacter sp. JUb119]TDU22581.1 TetR family transcriptional regulator [Arthrobacter sp. JUb115]